MQREIFTQDHDGFRDMVRAFIAKEITPYHEQWERDGIVSRDVWLAAGRAGLLGIHIDEKYGGGGDPDYRYYVILNEELARAGATGPMFQLHNDMIGPYLDRLCTPEQRERWLPGYCSGELIAAIAMTEPGAGSDLQGIRSTAVREGDHYVLNGQKTFISNGQLGDIVIVVARTDPGRRAPRDQPARGRARDARLRPRPRTSTSSACTRRTPRSCSSPTSGCRPRTCSARRAAASSL